MRTRRRSIATRLMALLFALVMALAAISSPVFAATFEDINNDDVWHPHAAENGGYCVISANAMMLRRAAMMNGDKGWASITCSALAS